MTQADQYLDEFGVSKDALWARGLRPFKEATSLEIVEVGEDGREHRLVPGAANAWREIKLEAARDSVPLVIVSAYRSLERQAEIIRSKLRAGQPIEQILTVSAFPGFSEHHTGRALDLSMPGFPALEVEFEKCPAFQWLSDRAVQFGFLMSYPPGNSFGYQYEPWHWCFRERLAV